MIKCTSDGAKSYRLVESRIGRLYTLGNMAPKHNFIFFTII